MAKSVLKELRDERAAARQTAGFELLARLIESGGGLLDLPEGVDFGPRPCDPDARADPSFAQLPPWPAGGPKRSECGLHDIASLAFDPRDSATALGVLAWCPSASAAEAAVGEAAAACAGVERELAARAEAAGYRGWNVKFAGRVAEAGVVDLSFVAAHRVVTVMWDDAKRPAGLSAAEFDLAGRALRANPGVIGLKMRSSSGVARHASWFDLRDERRCGANVADALIVAWDAPPEVRLAATRKERPTAPPGDFKIGKWDCTYIY